jgi:hypothetical protein
MHNEVQLRLSGDLLVKGRLFSYLSVEMWASGNVERAKMGVGRVLKNIANSPTSL